MNIEDFRDYCLGLPGATEETPFGPDTLVFKVDGKIFALTDLQTFASVNLKCEPERAAELREQHDYVRPGFHMNKKHWNTVLLGTGAPDAQVRAWTAESYQLVAAALPKAARAELARAPRKLAPGAPRTMQISSRFSVAVHVLALLASQAPAAPLTSDRMASSVNTNAVVIRRILGQLKKAGLVEVRAAAGGTFLRHAPASISLLDVYRAVEVVAENKLFHVHASPNPRCAVGRNIQAALDATLVRAQTALERELARVTLAQVVADLALPVAA